jgi:hypothetical protein
MMHVVRLVVQKRAKVWDQLGAVDRNRGKDSLDNGGISLLDATSSLGSSLSSSAVR